MNAKAKEFRERPCVVCGFRWSDGHHLFGRKEDPGGEFILVLCPNHHRCAHILMAHATGRVVRSYRFGEPDSLIGPTWDETWAWARREFDPAFCETAVLEILDSLDVDWKDRQEKRDAADAAYRRWIDHVRSRDCAEEEPQPAGIDGDRVGGQA